MGRWRVPGSASGRLVAAAAALAVAHQLLFAGWWIDDAAITFSYARNLVNGDGLVPWPGGERVEGYSDPTWLLLIAAGLAVRLDPFVWAKILGAAFGVVTVVLVGRLAGELADEEDVPATSLAPVLLAGSAQFAIWSASGLENGLFGMLLVAGILGLLRELRTGGAPWSALAFLALVWTRPEGAMYAVVALAWSALVALRDRRGGWAVARWSLVVVVPSLALEGRSGCGPCPCGRISGPWGPGTPCGSSSSARWWWGSRCSVPGARPTTARSPAASSPTRSRRGSCSPCRSAATG